MDCYGDFFCLNYGFIKLLHEEFELGEFDGFGLVGRWEENNKKQEA